MGSLEGAYRIPPNPEGGGDGPGWKGGDPVDIICGTYGTKEEYTGDEIRHPSYKGVIELLWNTFGGTENSKGYKVLDPHIGAIYGDSITLERARLICERLEKKGFASSNIVFGVGSFTYQYNTRDTYGFAMKATYGEVDGVGREIFKDPVTDDGTKRSLKGLLAVHKNEDGFFAKDQCSREGEEQGELRIVYIDGELVNPVDLHTIRERVHSQG